MTEDLTPKEHAQEFLLGNLIKTTLKQLKSLDKPFNQLPENTQRKVLLDVERDIRKAVSSAIDIVASNARMTFTASVDQVVFKDGVKAVLTMGKTQQAHSLADVEGGTVLIVIEDRETLLQIGDPVTATPDQQPLV